MKINKSIDKSCVIAAIAEAKRSRSTSAVIAAVDILGKYLYLSYPEAANRLRAKTGLNAPDSMDARRLRAQGFGRALWCTDATARATIARESIVVEVIDPTEFI